MYYYFVFCYVCGCDETRRDRPYTKCPDCWDTNIETGQREGDGLEAFFQK